MRHYKIQLGRENTPLKTHTVEANNLDEARRIAYKLLNEATNFGQGPEWYDYINVKPAKKSTVKSVYTEYYETEEEAYDEDEAANKHMEKLLNSWGDIEYDYNDRSITEVKEKEA